MKIYKMENAKQKMSELTIQINDEKNNENLKKHIIKVKNFWIR
jgi:hypothetical protein